MRGYFNMDFKEICSQCEGFDWIELAQDRLQCRALISRAMKCFVPLKQGIS